ncbi:MAG TPA: alternative ribosome rescue aminoacyl-tRNA hydrolase ArfB [Brevundimonas sp.]|uniref:alternative ribosome rescue aminoacyl-tRNA hydrolase ArfB n=1 Tax=Brevundimonas sp. TaxID=1871086 RepID=UPI002C24FEDF|nr:alternative ribosome rescue aminoacyl-tRNA hydrolase ArfB [Brevundimonas sp.]HRH20362.1 alternative ribosome rescue aminoacyl-tRNA hydrolase ArfB [Brevundimonas sp.]
MTTSRQAIPEEALEFRFFRAGGPGGQNVNKVDTAVQLRFDAAGSSLFDDEVRARLIRLAGQRATKDGVIVITAQRYRTQDRNRQDAVERLNDLVDRAHHRPKPRKPTKPTKASRERRLVGKAVRAGVKKGRGRVRMDD